MIIWISKTGTRFLQQIINSLVDDGLVGKVGDNLYYPIGERW